MPRITTMPSASRIPLTLAAPQRRSSAPASSRAAPGGTAESGGPGAALARARRLGHSLSTFAVGQVQRYTEAGGEKRTDNDKYVVYDDSDTNLYVGMGGAAPQPNNLIVATGRQRNVAGFQYAEYRYDTNRNFTNDCLTLAENLTRGTDVDSGRAELRATGDNPRGAERLFGQTDQQNRTIANGAWPLGQGANPNVGQAYAITRTRLPQVRETPYHAAAVVAKDGVDNVTLEADAGAQHAAPVFDIYDTTPAATRVNPMSMTFEERYQGTYGPPATGVLTRRTD